MCMISKSLLVFAVAVGAFIGSSQTSNAQFRNRVNQFNQSYGVGQGSPFYALAPGTYGDVWARGQAANQPWHGDYYYLKTGQPTALVVPPNVVMQQNYSWGVSQNTVTPVYHQFGYGPASGSAPGIFKATPYWPSHTDQFGIYPVRGPW